MSRPRGQNARSKSPTSEVQARTPSSISARTESHLDSLHSPFTETPNPRESPVSLYRSPSIDSKPAKRPPESPSPASTASILSKRFRQRSPQTIKELDTLTPKTTEDDCSSDEDMASVGSWDDKFLVVNHLALEWNNDPYPTKPALVLHYMNLYFSHVNSAIYCMFPNKAFLRWLQYEKDKSPAELMVVYSMLAMGSIFSSRPEKAAEGAHFCDIARLAVGKNHGVFSLQLIQSRMLLALYHFSIGESTISWDYGGSACRAVAGLKMNLEKGIVNTGGKVSYDYGLNKHGLAECYRRTYWSAFLMDVSFCSGCMSISVDLEANNAQRFNGYCSGHLGILHKEDAFARLPCDEEMYENQKETRTPYLDNGIVDSQLSNPQNRSCLGSMAYLVQIACIWDDILAYIYRSVHRSREFFRAEYDRFYRDTYIRLDSWHSSLPRHLISSSTNMALNLKNGNIGNFMTLHSLFHMCYMTLNRHTRHGDLSDNAVCCNVNEATRHALQLLNMIVILSKSTCETQRSSTSQYQSPHTQQLRLPTFSAPFPGCAILVAVDIVSAAGSLERELLRDTLRVMNDGLKIVIQLSRYWSSGKSQRKEIMRRIEDVANVAIDFGSDIESGMKKAWAVISPMEKTVGPEQDVFYIRDPNSMVKDGMRLLRMLGLDIEEEQVVFVSEGQSRRSSVESCQSEDYY